MAFPYAGSGGLHVPGLCLLPGRVRLQALNLPLQLGFLRVELLIHQRDLVRMLAHGGLQVLLQLLGAGL